MKSKGILITLCLALCVVLPGLAMAETTFDGTVVSSESVSVTAPFGGNVSSFRLRAGDQINVGDSIATVQTTKVYASTTGEVTGVFGQPGDSVSDVVSRYGAVLYIVPNSKYTITADIEKAYNDSDTKYVNIGETVYMRSYSDDYDHTAVGTITATDGTAYTVETTEGELMMEETVTIYRSSTYKSSSRIGRGTVSRTSEVAVGSTESTSTATSSTATTSTSTSTDTVNSIMYMHVNDGDQVERGQLLYETVTGSLDGLYATSNEIISDVSGIIASVDITAGNTISKGDTLITVYPHDKMQVEIEIDEYDLVDLNEGDQVTLEFNYDDSSSSDCVGTVAMISHVSETTSTSDVAYEVYIDFTPNDNIRLGMTVVANTSGASTLEAVQDSDEATLDAATQEEEATPQATTEDVTEAVSK
jgi:HlyD family secretion protein